MSRNGEEEDEEEEDTRSFRGFVAAARKVHSRQAALFMAGRYIRNVTYGAREPDFMFVATARNLFLFGRSGSSCYTLT